MAEYLLGIYAFAADEAGNNFLYNYPQYLSPTETLILQNHTGFNPQFTNSQHQLQLALPPFLNNQSIGRIKQYEEQQQLLLFFEQLVQPHIPTSFTQPNLNSSILSPKSSAIGSLPSPPPNKVPISSQSSNNYPQQSSFPSSLTSPHTQLTRQSTLTPTSTTLNQIGEPILLRSETSPLRTDFHPPDAHPASSSSSSSSSKPAPSNTPPITSITPNNTSLQLQYTPFHPRSIQNNQLSTTLHIPLPELFDESEYDIDISSTNLPIYDTIIDTAGDIDISHNNTPLPHSNSNLNQKINTSQQHFSKSMQTIILRTGEAVSIPAAPSTKSSTTSQSIQGTTNSLIAHRDDNTNTNLLIDNSLPRPPLQTNYSGSYAAIQPSQSSQPSQSTQGGAHLARFHSGNQESIASNFQFNDRLTHPIALDDLVTPINTASMHSTTDLGAHLIPQRLQHHPSSLSVPPTRSQSSQSSSHSSNTGSLLHSSGSGFISIQSQSQLLPSSNHFIESHSPSLTSSSLKTTTLALNQSIPSPHMTDRLSTSNLSLHTSIGDELTKLTIPSIQPISTATSVTSANSIPALSTIPTNVMTNSLTSPPIAPSLRNTPFSSATNTHTNTSTNTNTNTNTNTTTNTNTNTNIQNTYSHSPSLHSPPPSSTSQQPSRLFASQQNPQQPHPFRTTTTASLTNNTNIMTQNNFTTTTTTATMASNQHQLPILHTIPSMVPFSNPFATTFISQLSTISPKEPQTYSLNPISPLSSPASIYSPTTLPKSIPLLSSVQNSTQPLLNFPTLATTTQCTTVSSGPLSSIGLLHGNNAVFANTEIKPAPLPPKPAMFLSLTQQDAIKRLVCTHSLVGRILHTSLDGIHIIATPTRLPKRFQQTASPDSAFPISLIQPSVRLKSIPTPPTPSSNNSHIGNDAIMGSNVGSTAPAGQPYKFFQDNDLIIPHQLNRSYDEGSLHLVHSNTTTNDIQPSLPQMRQLGIASRAFHRPQQDNSSLSVLNTQQTSNQDQVRQIPSSSGAASTTSISTASSSSNILALTFALAPHTPPDIIHKFTTLSILFTTQLSDSLKNGHPSTIFQPFSAVSSHKPVLTHLEQFRVFPSLAHTQPTDTFDYTSSSTPLHSSNDHQPNSSFWSQSQSQSQQSHTNHLHTSTEDVVQIPRIREIITTHIWDYFNTQTKESTLIQFIDLFFSFSPSHSNQNISTPPSLLTELMQKQPIYHHVVQQFLVSYISAHLLSVYSTTCQAIKLLFHQLMMFNQINLYHNNRQLLFSFQPQNTLTSAVTFSIQHSRYLLPYLPTIAKFGQYHVQQYHSHKEEQQRQQWQYQHQQQLLHYQQQQHPFQQNIQNQYQENLLQSFSNSKFQINLPQHYTQHLSQHQINRFLPPPPPLPPLYPQPLPPTPQLIIDQLNMTLPSVETINAYYKYHLTLVHPILQFPSKYTILLLFPHHVLLDKLSTIQHTLISTKQQQQQENQLESTYITSSFSLLNAINGSTPVSLAVIFSTIVNYLTLLNPFTPVESIPLSVGYYLTLYFLLTQHLIKIIPIVSPNTVLYVSSRFLLSEDHTNMDPLMVLRRQPNVHHQSINTIAAPTSLSSNQSNATSGTDRPTTEYHVPLAFLNPESIPVQQALQHWSLHSTNQLKNDTQQVIESFTQFLPNKQLNQYLPPVQQFFVPTPTTNLHLNQTTNSDPVSVHDQIQQSKVTSAQNQNQTGHQFHKMAQDMSFQPLTNDFTSNDSITALLSRYTLGHTQYQDGDGSSTQIISQHHLSLITSAFQIMNDFSIAQHIHGFPAESLYYFLILLQSGRRVNQLLDQLLHEAQTRAQAHFFQTSHLDELNGCGGGRTDDTFELTDDSNDGDANLISNQNQRIYHASESSSVSSKDSKDAPSCINTAAFATGFIQLVQYCLIHDYITFLHPNTRYLLPSLSEHEHTTQIYPNTCEDCQFLYSSDPIQQRFLYRLAFPLRPFLPLPTSAYINVNAQNHSQQHNADHLSHLEQQSLLQQQQQQQQEEATSPFDNNNVVEHALYDQECINYLYRQQYGHGFPLQYFTPDEIAMLQVHKERLGFEMFIDLDMGV